jgi:hypothetical protein
VCVVIRDNAEENKFREVIKFLNQMELRATSALHMSSRRMAKGNHLSIP